VSETWSSACVAPNRLERFSISTNGAIGMKTLHFDSHKKFLFY
jgi:hypothetical protein